MLETAVISSGVVGEAVLILPDFSEVNTPSDLFSVSANMGEEACIDDDFYYKIYDGKGQDEEVIRAKQLQIAKLRVEMNLMRRDQLEEAVVEQNFMVAQ